MASICYKSIVLIKVITIQLVLLHLVCQSNPNFSILQDIVPFGVPLRHDIGTVSVPYCYTGAGHHGI